MTLSIRVHFDGKTFVPDEPVSMPINTPATVDVQLDPAAPFSPPGTVESRLHALDELLQLGVKGVNLPDSALSRESIYSDEE